jgi:hypothetical protein
MTSRVFVPYQLYLEQKHLPLYIPSHRRKSITFFWCSISNEQLSRYSLFTTIIEANHMNYTIIESNKHLEISAEALQYQLTFNSYLAAKSPEKNWYLSMGMLKNSKFLNRLSLRAQHTKIDLLEFL